MENNNYEKIFADMLEGLDLTLAKDNDGGYILYDYMEEKAVMDNGYSATCTDHDYNSPHGIEDYRGVPNATAKDLYEAIPKAFIEDRYWSTEGVQYEFSLRFKGNVWSDEYSELTMQGWLDFAKNPTETETKSPYWVEFAECYIIKEFDLICNHLEDVDVDKVYTLLHSGYEKEEKQRFIPNERNVERKEDEEKPKKKSSHDYER